MTTRSVTYIALIFLSAGCGGATARDAGLTEGDDASGDAGPRDATASADSASADAGATDGSPSDAGSAADLGTSVDAGGADSGPRADGRPNFVVIVADDLGYGDVGAYGNRTVTTPAIDAMAARGVRFTNAYSTAPVCAPSRVGILTGRYQQHFGFEFNTDDEGAPPGRGLAPGAPTVADTLGAAGYATGIVGKWHLGANPEFRPRQRGFREYFGFLAGGRDYVPNPANPTDSDNFLDRDDALQSVPFTGYLTDVFEEEAVAFIQRHRSEPFFLYLAPTAPHVPLQATTADLARISRTISPADLRTYHAMIVSLDDLVARVVATLREAGLEGETYVFLVSDNGGSTFRIPGVANNTPLRYGKGVLFEGGVRVPFIMTGPAIGARELATPTSTLDLAPTMLALARVAPPAGAPLDGRDLSATLAGGSSTRDLYWRLGPSRAIRRGNLKLLESGSSTWLFDLAADPGETRDLHAMPSRALDVTALRAALDTWSGSLTTPLWRGQVPPPGVLTVDGQPYQVEY